MKDRFIPKDVNLVLEPAPSGVLAKQAEAMAELFKSYAKGGAESATENGAERLEPGKAEKLA
jgi:hypothetical protein